MLITLLFALVSFAPFPLPAAPEDVPTLAKAALAGDATAVDKLRALGQPGLDTLVALRRGLSSVPPIFVGPQTPEVTAWENLVDRVARQRYASASGLYWYTDLEAAKAKAKADNKPILSLRLLGDLGADLSCANSRFFRTILYPDPAIAKALHDGWILHWESVHQVPTIKIDFGDGRVLTRTITGNSLHYALTPDGQVAEMMPGMVGPQAFLAWLGMAGDFTREVSALPRAQRTTAVARHVRGDLRARLIAWQKALAAVGVESTRDIDALAGAMTDKVLEQLAAGTFITISDEANALVGPMMGGLPGSRLLGRMARAAMPIAVTKAAVEAPMLRLVSPVEGTLARDEVKNTFEMKARLAALMLDEGLLDAAELPALTQAIYARAFLTPLDDPWMGLAPADIFTALPPALEKSTTASR